MFSLLICSLFFIPSIDANPSLHSLPSILIDASSYPRSDLLVHDFRPQFPSTSPYRCLLQVESKYFYLNPSCQLFTRTSLKQLCSFNFTHKFELVLPQNTTVYQLHLLSNQNNCQSNQKNLCQFERNPYRLKLKENQLFTNFLQIKTLPTCASSNYRLSSTNTKKNLEYFSLNSSTGYLSLRQPLDYESMTTWKLVLQAVDQHHIPFYTYVIIDVDDVNDCPPLLSWNFPLQTIHSVNDTDPFNIQISIDESKVEQKNIILANFIASDLDSPSKFHLQINSSRSLPFAIDGPYGDSTYVLLTKSKLDHELQASYDLNLILDDHGQPRLTSYYKLHISLLDNNDNPPKFDKDIYYVDIQENNFVNTTLLQVFANDSDSKENGRITYHLINEPGNSIWIDEQTGVIRTKVSFNHEELQTFSFNVTAVDHPKTEQQFNSTATVIVNIIDQNDNIPKFPYPIYDFSIYENNPPHTYIGEVLASDEDNSSLTYTFDRPSSELSTVFSISPSDGKIYAHQSFDREQIDHYTFHIIAFDGYHTSSRAEIRVQILDLNDQLPRFLFPNENNDTLILDRQYWNANHFLSRIEIHDNDLISTHTLLLIHRLDQLRNYDYLKQSKHEVRFDSEKFFLDEQGRLFLNSSVLNEGVYYLAFKIIDGSQFYDEKLLKLIVVDDYQDVPKILQEYDYLGLYLNNRFAYLQNLNSKTRQGSSSSFDQSNKYLLIILFAILIVILISITCLFISLIRRRAMKKQQLLRNSIALNSMNHNLHVRNCYDYNDLRTSASMVNDNCCLLETIQERDIYEQQKSKIASLNRYDSSTFQTLSRHSQTPIDYTIATVSSPSNICSETPVSSDDGFCGSSDTSDPSLPGHHHHHHHSHYLTSSRQPYLVVKDQLSNQNAHSLNFTNGTDTARRVRFNLVNHQQEQALEQMYISNSTVV